MATESQTDIAATKSLEEQLLDAQNETNMHMDKIRGTLTLMVIQLAMLTVFAAAS